MIALILKKWVGETNIHCTMILLLPVCSLHTQFSSVYNNLLLPPIHTQSDGCWHFVNYVIKFPKNLIRFMV